VEKMTEEIKTAMRGVSGVVWLGPPHITSFRESAGNHTGNLRFRVRLVPLAAPE